MSVSINCRTIHNWLSDVIENGGNVNTTKVVFIAFGENYLEKYSLFPPFTCALQGIKRGWGDFIIC
jgi:hypothetical protein